MRVTQHEWQYRSEIAEADTVKFLGEGLSLPDLRGYFPDLDLGKKGIKNLYRIGEAFIRRSFIKFELCQESYKLYIDKYYFHDLETDEFSETFTEIEIDCSETSKQNPALDSFMEVIMTIFDLESQALSKFQRFIKFKNGNLSQEYYYFVGVELLFGFNIPPETQQQIVQRFHKIIKDCVISAIGGDNALMIPMSGNITIAVNGDWAQVELVARYIRSSIEKNNIEDTRRRIKYKMAVHFGSIFKFTTSNNDMSFTGDGIEMINDILEKSSSGKFLISELTLNKISKLQVATGKTEKAFEIKENGDSFTVYEYSLDE